MSEMSFLQPRNWDSERLGVKVARIMPEELNEVAFHECLLKAKHDGVQLLYWAIPSENKEAIHHASQHGSLVDHKVTYLVDLKTLNLSSGNAIESYPNIAPSDELLYLAYESGKYSRFRNDSKLTQAQFQEIYRVWITNSTNRSIADDVLVIYLNDKLAGMVTVGKKNDRGDIGLLAVAEFARGQQIGSRLVRAAQQYFIDNGFSYSQVVTQQENIPACRLYEKCGYHAEKVEFFFHFWL